MYIFVVIWNPIIQGNCSTTETHLSSLGLIFSAFMVSMTIGSQIYAFCVSKQVQPYAISSYSFAVGSVSLYIPALVLTANRSCYDSARGSWLVFLSFCIFESICGLYYPVVNGLKAKWFSPQNRTGLISIARVGQNIIITIVLLISNAVSNAIMIFVASSLLVCCTIVQNMFSDVKDTTTASEQNIVPPDVKDNDDDDISLNEITMSEDDTSVKVSTN